MEKDHFKDRSHHGTMRQEIPKGSVVYICLKENQKKITKDDMSLLTKCIVVHHLGMTLEHPRGVKVRGYIIPHDKFPNKATREKAIDYYAYHKNEVDSEEDTPINKLFCKGRVVYLLNDYGEIIKKKD